MSAALFERSSATNALVQLLAECGEGDTVSFETMRRVTNRDVQGRDRHILDAARRIALGTHRASFCAVTRVGLRRMLASELAHEGQRHIVRISRSAKRAGRLLDSGDLAKLTSDQRLQHSATRGVLAALENSAQRPVVPSQTGSRDPVVRIA